MKNFIEHEKLLAAREAVRFVENGMIVGLGTGSTAAFAIKEIGKRVAEGLKINGVPTSGETAALALSLGIPLLGINDVDSIDITIDGADEFTESLQLIKGGGGALFREKIVAGLTKNEIIIADASKQVERLGKFKVPIEVVPFAERYVLNQVSNLHGSGTVRKKNGQVFKTDQHNIIIDADFGLIDEPEHLSGKLNNIEGVVAHGLFIKLASMVIMGKGDTVVYFKG